MDGQIAAAERVEMRRWLVKKGIQPHTGSNTEATLALMGQVCAARGDGQAIMAQGRAKVERRREEALRGGD